VLKDNLLPLRQLIAEAGQVREQVDTRVANVIKKTSDP
jgi:hypothetical protein